MEKDADSPEWMVADMEKTIAANARMLARAGHSNRKESAGIKHAKTLMMRPKPGVVRQQKRLASDIFAIMPVDVDCNIQVLLRGFRVFGSNSKLEKSCARFG